MTELELATILAVRTTAEVADLLPRLAAEVPGILWFTTSGGVSTFIFADRAMSSDHGPAEAARLWGLGFLHGPVPALIATGPEGMAGVTGEIIDPFLRNTGDA